MPFAGKTILFAWELGEGLGHLPALKAIARGVKDEGATPVFALCRPEPSRAVLRDLNAKIVPAPYWPVPAVPANPSGSYADILSANGYASAVNLRALIEAWGHVLAMTKPDLVVCEHAPTAALAAFGRIPVAFVGNGFVVPPADDDLFPPYQAGKGDASLQRPVLAAMQEALKALKRAAPATICEPFRGVFHGIFTFPELDTYYGRRREAALGPIEAMPPLTPLPTKRRLFAYSAADYALVSEVTKSLMDLGSEASVYFRGSLGARAAVIKSRGVQVYDHAPALTSVLADASAVFSHGGTGFTNAALAAGRPHIMAPRHFEAQATGSALEAMGAGISFQPFEGKRFREAVARANEDAAMREAAQSAGAKAQAFIASAKALETTVRALEACLA